MTNAARAGFGAETTTDQVLDGIDLSGKRVLITGATSGLGQESARAMAAKGASIVITGRNMPKAEQVAAGIRESTGNQNVSVQELELGSFASIRAFAERFLQDDAALDILINNAGVMACPYEETADGLEMQFGTNHIGHFLMTCLIAPALLKAGNARIVSLSSRGHQMSPVVFEDIGFKDREYQNWLSYGQSKTANALFAVELEKRLGGRGVHAYSVHPGVIMTELSRHMKEEDFEFLQTRAPSGGLAFKSTEAGAATQVYAATAPELEGRGGVYLEDCHVAEVDDSDGASEGVRSYALDSENAAKLWKASEEIVGQTFDL